MGELIPGQWGFEGEAFGLARACALEECGRVFVSVQPKAAYCCAAHRQKAYRRRQGVPRGAGRHHFGPGRG